MVLIVVVILGLGIGSFVGARWWLSRDEAAVTPAPASTATAEPPSANGARPGKNAAAPTGPPETTPRPSRRR